MATITNHGQNITANLDAYRGSVRVGIAPRGIPYATTGVSGIIAATTNGALFSMRLDANIDPDWIALIHRVQFTWTTITAFTTPATIRSLLLTRSAVNATPSGGAASGALAKNPNDAPSRFTSGGGEIRIATTAALGVTGLTWETQSLGVLQFTGQGAASGTATFDFNHLNGGGPIAILPGHVLGIRTNGALDAAGTGCLAVNVEWVEGVFE